MHSLASAEGHHSGRQGATPASSEKSRGHRTPPQTRLLMRALEQSREAIIITDTTGRIEYVNPRFEEMTGYTTAEALGQNPRIIKSGEQSPELYAQLWATITRGQEWRGEFHNRRKTGEYYWDQTSISPVHDESGQLTHFIAIKEEITARKRSEHQTLLLAALVENTGDICVLKDRELRVMAINQAGARLLGGCDRSALIGRTSAEMFRTTPEDPLIRGYHEAEKLAQTLKPGERVEREEAVIYADGSRHTHLTRYFPVFDHDGLLIATGNISIDITARKNAEEELRQSKEAAEAASRAKSVFLTNISHELRTPLNAINGVAALLASDRDISPDTRNAIGLIQQSGESLLGIIEEVLLFSGLQAGKTKLALRPFDLLDVVVRALRIAEAGAREKGLPLTYWIDPALSATVVGDPQRFQQVLLNLLANALKFTERGRVHLGLRLGRSGPGVHRIECYVLDTGVGIAPAALTKLFRPFSQADDTVTRRFGGTGLGLAITKSLVELMHGRIDVRSREGRGTAFRLELEFSATTATKTVFASSARPEFVDRTVLVVDGDSVVRASIRNQLSSWRTKTLTAKNIAAARTIARKIRCDLAIVVIPHCGRDVGLDAVIRNEMATIAPTVFFAPPDFRADKADLPKTLTLPRPVGPIELSQAMAQLLSATPTVAEPPHGPSPLERIADRVPLEVLVVDDIRTNREAARMILRRLGYTAVMAENGAEAVAALEKHWFDLILLDLQMPVMDGLAAAREIRRRYAGAQRRPKLVALTANALPNDREMCLDAGMDEYLSKPVLPEQIQLCILRLFTNEVARPGPIQAPRAPSVAAGSQPWIDVAHHQAMMNGVEPAAKWQLLDELFQTFQHDVRGALPELACACRVRNSRHAAELAHGLKGGAQMLGWARMAARCAELVHELRAGTFAQWDELPPELDEIFRQSREAMAAILANEANHQPPVTVSSLRQSSP